MLKVRSVSNFMDPSLIGLQKRLFCGKLGGENGIACVAGGGSDDRAGAVPRQQVRCCLHQQQPDHPPQHPHQRVLHHRQSAR